MIMSIVNNEEVLFYELINKHKLLLTCKLTGLSISESTITVSVSVSFCESFSSFLSYIVGEAPEKHSTFK